ncbi:MAG: electron transport complex subunit RsxC [Chitinispirillales bacterium]|nr:electron transport complex subunit RsxC [Chitinispirillales bacterium]
MPKKFTFRGGVHPSHEKSQTEQLETERFPAPSKVVIPLAQSIGAPANALVKKGDRVRIGQLIGEASGNVSAAVHSSVAGTIISVQPFGHPSGKQITAVEIENDGSEEKIDFEPLKKSWREAAPGELVQKIATCGIVGMGGASFPTHVKLSPPSSKPIDTLIINGAECEPFLTTDHRLMIERTEELLTGVLILKKILHAKNVYIGIEDNKPDAITEINKWLVNSNFSDISLAVLKSKYPQGGEKQLITAITGRKVPSGGLPMDVGCVVQNAHTASVIRDAVIKGFPLFQRVITVTGPAVKSPKNLLVRIGTSVRTILEACDTDFSSAKKIIMGGPMMGLALSGLEIPVIKSTSGLLAYDKITSAEKKYPCINCGFCVSACPVGLVPSRIAKYVSKNLIEEAAGWHLMDCVECGSCAYNCPAKNNLVHYMKLGKYTVHAARAASTK